MKTTSEMVVDTASSHLAQGELAHIEKIFVAAGMPVAQEAFQIGRIGELGLRAKAAMHHVKIIRQSPRRIGEQVWRQDSGAGFKRREFFQAIPDLLHALRHFTRPSVVGFGDCGQNPREPRAAITVLRGEVGPAIEGFLRRREEQREGPAPLAAKHLHDALVNVVQVRTLFTVHFDAHEVLVHQCRDALVLEGLVFHHMAPVTGRIANRQQDWLVFSPCFRECFRPPRKPVHRVMRVLE